MIRKQGITRICVATLFITFNILVSSAQKNIGKEMHETFEINPRSSLSIENKYGDIDIRNWDKNIIDVHVQVLLQDVSDQKAKELLEMITIKHHVEDDKVIFETKFDDNFSKSLMRINGDKDFEVNYTVNMPHTLVLNVLNKYGNVFIEKLSSPSSIAVKYGKLKANDISSVSKDPLTQVSLGYSEGDITKCSWLKVNIKYSKLNIEDSKALIIISKYSKLYIERGSSLVTESKYDDYYIGTLANFVTEAEFCEFEFNSIGKKIVMETKYSDVKIDYVPASFDEIKITNRYGGYSIGIENGASYKIKGFSKYGNISYPNNSRVNRSQETTELQVEGLVGSNSETNSKVIIDTKYGAVKLGK